MDRPLIGITCDVLRPETSADRPRMVAAITYADAVAKAGGVPVLLAPLVELIPEYLRTLGGFVFTGGDDPAMEPFGKPTHPQAKPVDPLRQQFETALLRALDRQTRTPVLGVCLGMQMMALAAGGELNQHLPDDCPTASMHHPDAGQQASTTALTGPADPLHSVIPERGIEPRWAELLNTAGDVASHHRQAVSDPGRLRVLARSPDGLIEAIGTSGIDGPWRLGVQWHPERTVDDRLGQGLFRALVTAASRRHPAR